MMDDAEQHAPSRPCKPSKIRIVCVSDTHGHANGEGFKLPEGDILVHAGDLTNQGSLAELQKAAQWIEQAQHAVKIVVAGNHELSLDANYTLKHREGWTVSPAETEACRALIRNIPGVIYLEHEGHEFDFKGRHIRIFGSPYTLDSAKQNWAFQYSPNEADEIWRQVLDVDILITHSPPAGLLDASKHWIDGGCPALLRHVKRIKPRLHIFGHHHEGRGACTIVWDGDTLPWTDPGAGNRKQSLLDLTRVSNQWETTAINASILKNSWSASAAKAFNKPIVVDVSTESFACS